MGSAILAFCTAKKKSIVQISPQAIESVSVNTILSEVAKHLHSLPFSLYLILFVVSFYCGPTLAVTRCYAT